MTAAVYVKYELLRTFRNRRFIFLSLGFPLVIYFLIAAPNRHESSIGGTGISAPLYFMVGLAAFGCMNAMLAAGARIAAERSVGWNRQLRLTPLSTRMYFRTKVLTGYVMALCTLVLLYIAGSSLGVRLSAGHWLHMTGFILIGLVPFAVLGILLGHLLTVDSIGPSIGGITALFSILGGVWFPITSGVMRDLAQSLPSYWLVQAAHVGLGANGWGARGWLVDGLWTAALAALAVRAYRRDTGRA
jgi:ABC-2 type transport system permease protein